MPALGQVGARFLEHAQYPRNLGRVPSPDGVALGVGQCGDSMEVSLQVRGDTISEIKVMPHGCIYTVVCASALSELAKGKTVEGALGLNPEDLDRELQGLPEDHQHCARLAVNTLGEAIEDYYRRVNSPLGQAKA